MVASATYSFLDVTAAISGPGGSFSIGSDASPAEEGISYEMAGEKNTMVNGAAGDVMHQLNASDAGKVMIRLLKTSPVNRQLNQMYNLQKTSSSLWGQNTVSIRDVARGDVITLSTAAFAKNPNNGYGKDAPVMEWEFQGVLDTLLGSGAPALQ